MSTDEITIAGVLQEKNYKTGIFGKWHLGVITLLGHLIRDLMNL